MSKELVRFKHKKDIISCVEESWDYYGKEDDQRKVIKELNNVYKIASSAKNAPKPGYEAKAKAWDRTQELLKDCTGRFDASGEWDTNWCAFEDGIDEIIVEYESGGSDD